MLVANCGRKFVLPKGMDFPKTYKSEITVRITTSLKKWVAQVE